MSLFGPLGKMFVSQAAGFVGQPAFYGGKGFFSTFAVSPPGLGPG